jgi:hypothetical protein
MKTCLGFSRNYLVMHVGSSISQSTISHYGGLSLNKERYGADPVKTPGGLLVLRLPVSDTPTSTGNWCHEIKPTWTMKGVDHGKGEFDLGGNQKYGFCRTIKPVIPYNQLV